LKSSVTLVMSPDRYIRRKQEKHNLNTFSILSECMVPDSSVIKSGVAMEDWENPQINALQYANYGFDKTSLKPKKAKTPGLNPVNKTIDPKEALSLGQHVKGSGQARDLHNSPPQLNAPNSSLTSVDPDWTSKVESKTTSGNEAGPRGLRRENNYSGLQGTGPLIHQRVIGDPVTGKYAEKTVKGDVLGIEYNRCLQRRTKRANRLPNRVIA
jgi:hypothetical protein